MSDIILHSHDFFYELVCDAMEKRKLKKEPIVQSYLTDLLRFFLKTDHLFIDDKNSGKKSQPTLAELYLKAMNSEGEKKPELLKKLGDLSLYISGLFSESLNKKLIDVDYYANMGGVAYGALSDIVIEDEHKYLYSTFSSEFVAYMDVLTIIAQNTFIQNNENLLRLYDTYQRTGSELAKEHLLEKGLLQLPDESKKVYN